MKNKRKISTYLMPVIFGILLAAGVYMGANLKTNSYHNDKNYAKNVKNLGPAQKINSIFHFIESSYVDSVNMNQLIGESMDGILSHLDPHSYYIPAKKYTEMNQPLEGNFEGIGIKFRIIKDTVNILGIIEGGPSKRVGIKTGDKIIKVDTELIAGNKITNEKVMKLLKGPADTKVNITVYRAITGKELQFDITREKISIKSVIADYIIKDSIGYVKITRFAKNTYEEFHEIVSQLKKQGINSIIIDLRNNGGGIMGDAVNIANEFLKKGNLIVYTQGRERPKKNLYATGKGILKDTKLAILINAGSASASEILTGAIQDNDRGIVVGRRSFGKGLVQEQVNFKDGSAIRLTVAKYYTPSGRCIQKPYNKGIEKYREETYHRYLDGEMFNADSVHFPDSLKYHTKDGRTVYGGGGIMPDYYVPLDTTQNSSYLAALVYRGFFGEFAIDYASHNNAQLKKYKSLSGFVNHFHIDEQILQQYVDFAAKNKVKVDKAGLKRSKTIIKNRLKASIARDLFGEEGFYQVLNREDIIIQKTVHILENDPDKLL